MVEYLDDIEAEVKASVAALKSSREFKAIYKNSVATFVSLKVFSRKQLPLVSSAAELSRRLPVLVASRQAVQAMAELRRFIELVAWWPYFADHPVEWSHFQSSPWLGYVKYENNPIAFAAHREISHYFAYIVERSRCVPTSVLRDCVGHLQTGYSETSKFVHAGGLADPNSAMTTFDTLTPDLLREFSVLQKSILRAGSVIAAWSNPDGLHRLTAVERSWYDWLVGKNATNALRGGTVCD